jgi:Holliday junction resolvase RusA-like endonuclease
VREKIWPAVGDHGPELKDGIEQQPSSSEIAGLKQGEPVVIELAGEPRGKGRPRFARRSLHVYTPAKTASSEAMLRHEAALAMAGRAPLDGALRVRVLACFGVPQSWSAKKRLAAITGAIRPAKRPDLDNVVKMLDALNEVVWRDDAQVVEGWIEKFYSDRPRLKVEVSILGEAAS